MLDADPARVDPVHADGLSFRGVFQLLAGDLSKAVADLSASVRMVRHGATFTLGVRAYPYLALAQYLAGAWDDVLLTSEQGFSAAAVHPRRFELPLLHLAASCVPAARGGTEAAEYHIRMAEEAAAVLDYGQERLYAAMARALACQAAGDHRGMADALGHEVAYLVGQHMTNAEIASELFITPKAVEYHLGNIYAKFGLKGRQQLRDFMADSRRPTPV